LADDCHLKKNVYLQPFDFAFSAFAYSALTLFVQSINQSINQSGIA